MLLSLRELFNKIIKLHPTGEELIKIKAYEVYY